VEKRASAESVTVEMTREEAARIGFAMRAGYETISRPEYYIRSGLSQPLVREIARAPMKAESAVVIEFAEGIEDVESPRRPRPTD
jgi:hypothetical protein